MKTTTLIIVALVAAAFVMTAAFRPVRMTPAPAAIPDSVYAVFDKSCVNCHSDDGSGLAKGKVNFDKWNSYSSQKQVETARDIVNVMTKGSMPPGGFRKNNPDKVPTEADLKLINAWYYSF